jgi:alpha-glucosidase (family GH31 glycosyl hydrolase)
MQLESLSQFAYFAKLYKSLSPYRKHLIREANTRGWPLMRHLVLYYPRDPVVRQITYSQYLLGASLLVVPTLTPSVTNVKIYFPKEERGGEWRHIWTSQVYAADGQYVHVESPLQRPAVFIREPRNDQGLLDELLNFVSSRQ